METTPPPAEKVKRQRTSFTNAQRLQIVHHRAQNPSLTQEKLAEWAQETMELPRKPSQAMISKLLKRKVDLETMTNEELNCKSKRSVRFPQLDTALARWVAYSEDSGVPVTGELLRSKAARFAEILEIQEPLTFSNGWLYRFNERHGFGNVKAHKESKPTVESVIGDLKRRLQTFEPRNVFSMDETGLLFTFFPDRTGKRTAKRLTVVLACNADGSEQLPPLFIGKAEKPRGFSNATAAELNYMSTPNTYITREIFIKWLTQLDRSFQEQQRQCVLLIDSAAVHAGFNAEELRNVEVVLLPHGTPSNVQPLTAGITAAFKMRYRRRQIQHALDQLDADADLSTAAKFDSIGVRQAILWCIECWNAVPASLVTSCWQSTGLIYADSAHLAQDYLDEENAISDDVGAMLAWLHASSPMSVDELLDLPDERTIMDEPTDEDFCAPVESVKLFAQLAKPKPDDADGGLSAAELKERLKWIAKLLIYADEKGVPAESVSGMRVLQRDFRDQLNKKQADSS
jgi:hypothetical protein